MANTTNYNWETPDDTDLVKDGAAAIRTLGSAIDTTVFNNASAAIAKSIVDAKGDIIAATAADTVTRLAVGANNTVLTADSTTATGLKWATVSAGGMTEIASGTLSGTAVTISSIPGTYKNLQLVLRDPVGTNGTSVNLRINGDTGTNYFAAYTTASGAEGSLNSTQLSLTYAAANNQDNYSVIADIYDYTNTTAYKYVQIKMVGIDNSATPTYSIRENRGFLASTSAITSLTIRINGVETLSGTYILYGVA